MKIKNTMFARTAMILLLFSAVCSLPKLPDLVANQSFSYLLGFFTTYTLMWVAPIWGTIQLSLLRKQAQELSARFQLAVSVSDLPSEAAVSSISNSHTA
jgi:hypothetical protein